MQAPACPAWRIGMTAPAIPRWGRFSFRGRPLFLYYRRIADIPGAAPR